MAAVAVMLTAPEYKVQAEAPTWSNTGMAGISFYMDQFYASYKGEVVENAVVSEAAVEPRTLKKEPPVSEYENVGISIASNYVNIRKAPTTESEIVGKLYQGCAATITERDGEWVKITSGNAEGYINAEYLAIGFDAEELVEKYATRWAVVNVDGLRVRMEPSTEARIATLVASQERLLVEEIEGDWVSISMDNGDIEGYVAAEYVDIEVEFEHAITIEEEQAEIRRKKEAEEALKRQQEEQRRREEQRKKEQAAQQQSQQQQQTQQSGTTTETATGIRGEMVAFAKKFLGNPYVYGGTSLTNGIDCSAFVQAIYRNFGYTIPRDSRSQCAGAGYKISLDSVQPGDLIFYTNSYGTVNHVAMYIGNGQVIHASDPRSGIMISNMRYRTPYMAKRVID